MQDYQVVQFKKGDFQDQNGNYWCDMALKGVSEPVRIVVKDPMQFTDGMMLYGEIKQVTSKAGREYNRFYRAKKEDVQEAEANTYIGTPKPAWTPRDDSHIRAQWAIGQAVQLAMSDKFGEASELEGAVELWAKRFYAMVDRVKGSEGLKAPDAPVQKSVEDSLAQDQARRDQIAITAKKDEDDPEFASMLAKGFAADDIDLNDIPF